MNKNEKSWSDQHTPDGHLPASYETQVCDEGNKTIAVQMLDKAGIDYKISARKGQFYIQSPNMDTFTKVKRILDQSIDMNKEAQHLGFPPEVTAVGTNTPPEVNNTAVAKENLEEATSEKHQREMDCLDVMKNSSFIKKLQLEGGDIQNMLDALEHAWDLGNSFGNPYDHA